MALSILRSDGEPLPAWLTLARPGKGAGRAAEPVVLYGTPCLDDIGVASLEVSCTRAVLYDHAWYTFLRSLSPCLLLVGSVMLGLEGKRT